MKPLLLLALLALALASCRLLDPEPRSTERDRILPRDTLVSLSKGSNFYAANCARCHGDSAQGTANAHAILGAIQISDSVRAGNATMPAFPKATDSQIQSVEIFLSHFAQSAPAVGSTLYHDYCARCHGDSARGAAGPNLRGYSGIAGVVQGGKGRMKAIPALGLGQIEAIQQYLTALAPPAVADSQTNGSYLYARYCARCHGDSAGGGTGPNIQGFKNLVPVLSRGFGRRMPAFSWFSASQIEALTAFLARVSGGGGTELPAPSVARTEWIRFQPPWQQQFDDHRPR